MEKINKWHLINDRCENIFLDTQCSEQEILAAKIDEIKKWKENHVFEPIYYNGQKAITTRWVLTEKFVNEKKKIKARLVAQDFKVDSSEILKDSPTCTKGSLRLNLTIMASNRWTCNSINIKSVFLQGKEIDRVVYLTPPPEFEEKDIVCKLNTCIYGLSDASRNWYLCVKEELDKLGVKCSRFEPA